MRRKKGLQSRGEESHCRGLHRMARYLALKIPRVQKTRAGSTPASGTKFNEYGELWKAQLHEG